MLIFHFNKKIRAITREPTIRKRFGVWPQNHLQRFSDSNDNVRLY